MALRCRIGLHCWHMTGKEMPFYSTIKGHGIVPDKEVLDYHRDEQRCCKCPKTRAVFVDTT